MGLLFAKIFSQPREQRILMLGLDAAGKTTVLNKLNLGEVLNTMPTIGFNVETIKYKKMTMQIWDVGGQHRIRPLWRHYYQNTDALIYVVDSSDRERLNEAAEELHHILSDDLMANVTILVLANKQDMTGALPVKDIVDGLKLNKERRQWYVQGCVANKGDGLYDGLDWMKSALDKKKAATK